MMARPLPPSPALEAYAQRIGAERRGLGLLVVKTPGEGGYTRHAKIVRVARNGVISWSGDAFKTTDQEAADIAAEAANWPQPILAASIDGLQAMLGGDADLYVFHSQDRDDAGRLGIIWVQERREPKAYIPWVLHDNGEWYSAEPSVLPLFGLERLRDARAIMIHEGAKAARAAQRIVDERKSHPWLDELSGYHHLGWPGGALNPHRVDFDPIRLLPARVQVVLACDNDRVGVDAAGRISSLLKRPMSALVFDDLFPEGFDLADKWPERSEWWRSARYVGPRLDEMMAPATWATTTVPAPGRGNPQTIIRSEFANEWYVVTTPPVFVHRDRTYRLLNEGAFNRQSRPWSDVQDIARLMGRSLSSHADGITFAPGAPPGVVTIDGERLVNTWRPSAIRPEKGDDGPWHEFMTRLVPDERDRHEFYRWIATLIARPEIRMLWGVLAISEAQGVGKGTLGETILAPLVGRWNTSVPSEGQVVNSDFNGWIAHKRLAVIHEIYSGHNRKAYDTLKSIITDQFVEVNRKFVEQYQLENWVHIYACSNSARPLHLDDEDRRWFVPKLTEEPAPGEYWRDFHEWLGAGGLPIIADWAERFVRQYGAVQRGEPAPMTSAKMDVISESRSDGAKFAFDLATIVAKREQPTVLRMDEVRQWVAHQRKLPPEHQHMEGILTLRKALRAGGLQEPKRAGETRVKIDGRYQFVVANFEIEATATWDKHLKAHHMQPEQLAPDPM